MNELEWVFAIRNSPSDETLFIHETCVSNGEAVVVNEKILEVEGAKSIFEIESPCAGFIYFTVQKGSSVVIGQPIAVISKTPLAQIPDCSIVAFETGQGNDLPITKKQNMTEGANLFFETIREVINYQDPFFERENLNELDVKRFFTSQNDFRRIDKTKNTSILIIGGGTSAEIAFDILDTRVRQNIIGLVDPFFNSLEKKGIPLIGDFSLPRVLDLIELKSIESLIICQADMETRKKFLSFTRENGLRLIDVISATASISSSAIYGQGLTACDFARIGPQAFLGDNIFLSSMVNIDHHCVIGDNTTFGPGVFLSGRVVVGANCVFGSAIAVEPKIVIGENSIISSGAVITKNVPPNSRVKVSGQVTIRDRER